MSELILHVNDKTFEAEVLKSDIPVLVDLWAEWCGPCKMLTPVIEEVAKELSGRVKVVKVNVDESPEVSKNYSVMSIPTLILFKKGEAIYRSVGFNIKNNIIKSIEPFL